MVLCVNFGKSLVSYMKWDFICFWDRNDLVSCVVLKEIKLCAKSGTSFDLNLVLLSSCAKYFFVLRCC